MREIIGYFVWYIIPGVLWGGWLEYFTTKNLSEPFNRPWNMPERSMHIFFWPLSFSKFIIELFRGYFGYYDDEE